MSRRSHELGVVLWSEIDSYVAVCVVTLLYTITNAALVARGEITCERRERKTTTERTMKPAHAAKSVEDY